MGVICITTVDMIGVDRYYVRDDIYNLSSALFLYSDCGQSSLSDVMLAPYLETLLK